MKTTTTTFKVLRNAETGKPLVLVRPNRRTRFRNPITGQTGMTLAGWRRAGWQSADRLIKALKKPE